MSLFHSVPRVPRGKMERFDSLPVLPGLKNRKYSPAC